MAKLRATLNKDEYAFLADPIKGFYVKDGDGYKLDVDGLPTGDEAFEELRLRAEKAQKQSDENHRALLRERDELKTTKAELDGLKKGIGDPPKPGDDPPKDPPANPDVAKLSQQMREQLEEQDKANKAELARRDKLLCEQQLDLHADRIAGQFGDSAAVLRAGIRNRLTAEFGENGVNVTVLDAEGRPSTMSVDDYGSSLLTDPQYKGLVPKTKASGGGAAGSGTGKRTGGAKYDPKKGWDDYESTDLAAMRVDNPELYDQLKNAR